VYAKTCLFVDSTYCHTFDLTKKIETETLNGATLYLNSPEILNKHDCYFETLLQRLTVEINAHKESCKGEQSPRKVLRIALHNMGSPMWGATSLPVSLFVF
jgi:hypothetical protein